MANHNSGSLNPNWKGGRTVTSHGYVLIRVGKKHPLADCRGYAYEHRLKLMEKLGRVPLPEELAHHDDEDKQNNVPENLLPISRSDHIKLHKPRRGTGKPVCGRGHVKPIGETCRICENERARARYIKKPRDPETAKQNGKQVGAVTAARQKSKTHCPQGHPYDEANTRLKGNRRICKTCHRNRESKRRHYG